MSFDGKQFGREIVDIVKTHIASELAPLLRRLSVLEARAPLPGEKGERGEKGEPGESGAIGPRGDRGERGEPGAAGEKGERGEKGEPGQSGAAGPQGDRGERGEPGAAGEKGDKGDQGEPGAPGRDAEAITPEQVRDALLAMPEAILTAVSAYLAEHPPMAGPQGEPGQRGERGEKGEPGARGEKGETGATGADGVGLAGAVLDRDGQLILTLTNGETKALGAVVGRDGKDGLPGPAGRDGFSLEQFAAASEDDGRTLVLSFSAGEDVKKHTLSLPVIIDRGVWVERTETEAPYRRGDGVTWAGSFFIAQRDTRAKPETSTDWRLAVKRGRDGKEGKQGPAGPKGERGERGPQGAKW